MNAFTHFRSKPPTNRPEAKATEPPGVPFDNANPRTATILSHTCLGPAWRPWLLSPASKVRRPRRQNARKVSAVRFPLLRLRTSRGPFRAPSGLQSRPPFGEGRGGKGEEDAFCFSYLPVDG